MSSLRRDLLPHAFFALLVVSSYAYAVTAETVSICSSPSNVQHCEQLNKSQEAKCHQYTNKINCLRAVDAGNTTLAAVMPDEALLANHILKRIHVVAEIRPDKEKDEPYELDLVVLVKDPATTYTTFEGKKYCHPGFGKLNLPKATLVKFEDAVLERNERHWTTGEQRLAGLSALFGPSCRPGEWYNAIERDLNASLPTNTSAECFLGYEGLCLAWKGVKDIVYETYKKIIPSEASAIDMSEFQKMNYSRLCELCNATNEEDKCSIADVTDPFASAMDCFVNGGDVVLTSLKEVARRPTLKPVYFCENGTVGRLPCTWGRRTWPLIVTNEHNVTKAAEFLKKSYGPGATAPPGLGDILLPQPTDTVVLRDPVDLETYIKSHNASVKKPSFEPTIRWCTKSSDEMEKCGYLSAAVVLNSFDLSIDCTRSTDELNCLDDIEANNSDLTLNGVDFGFAARKKTLIPVAFLAPTIHEVVRSMIVVKNDTLKIDDLNELFGCFSEFGDVAYMSFFTLMAKRGGLKEGASFNEAAYNYLSEGCVPGFNDPYREAPNLDDISKACRCAGSSSSKTAATCSANSDNDYHGNHGALKCLKEIGNYSVITDKGLPRTTNESLYVMCRNGTVASTPGFDVDDACYLSITLGSEFVVRRDDERAPGIGMLLKEIYNSDTRSLIKMLDDFLGQKNLLYPDTNTHTLHLRSSEVEYVKNYVELFADIEELKPEVTSGVSSRNWTGSTLVAALALLLYVRP